IAWPRQMFFLLARELSGKSLPQIAMWCGNRDHSTVMYGARMARQRMERDPECLADYRACMEALGYRLSPERGPSDGE
ncbi:MAG: helix-turn-helix domain-containing protein, partial [Alphaproteobacteria bacterium]